MNHLKSKNQIEVRTLIKSQSRFEPSRCGPVGVFQVIVLLLHKPSVQEATLSPRIVLLMIAIINYSRVSMAWSSSKPSPLPCLTWHDAFFKNASFMPDIMWYTPFRNCLISLNNTLPKVFSRETVVFFLVTSGFHSPPVGSLLHNFFLIFEWWTPTSTEASEVCSFVLWPPGWGVSEVPNFISSFNRSGSNQPGCGWWKSRFSKNAVNHS